MLQGQMYVFLIMMQFWALEFLWANAIVINCVGESKLGASEGGPIYVDVKLNSNLFLILLWAP